MIIMTAITNNQSSLVTCDDNFDGVMYPPLPIARNTSVVREVAVPDSVDSQLRPIVHHLREEFC